MHAVKKHVLQLAQAHQYQLHPHAVKTLLDFLHTLDASAQEEFLQVVFSVLHDTCDSGNRGVSAECMSRAIDTCTSQSSSSKSASGSSFEVVDLDRAPVVVVDATLNTIRCVSSSSPSDARSTNRFAALRERLELAAHRCLRSGRYRSGKGTGEGQQLVPIAALEGISSTEVVSTIGLLRRDALSGKLFLENARNEIELNVELQEVPTEMVGNVSVAVCRGTASSGKFRAVSIALPPAESRSHSQTVLGGVDSFGLAPRDLVKAQLAEDASVSSVCVTLSQVYLDVPHCTKLLARFFSELDSRREDELREMCFVLVGSFVSHSWGLGNVSHLGEHESRVEYQALLATLGTLIQQHAPAVAQHALFVFVPGPHDTVGVAGALPAMPLPTAVTQGIRSRLRRTHFAPNPCRMRFHSQELIFFSQHAQHDMKAASIKWTAAAATPPPTDAKQAAVTVPPPAYEMVTKTICDAAHVAPLHEHILWKYDHYLRLLPLPHLLVLCDTVEQWQCRYRGATVVNPGCFATTGTFLWYTPCDKEILLRQVVVA